MAGLGFNLQAEATHEVLTLDVLKSSEIEGELLNPDQVRSSVARRLGLTLPGLVVSDRHVDGVVRMMLDATQNFTKPLTKKRLLEWQKELFPGGKSGLHDVTVGAFRGKDSDPMEVVSGPVGRERVHFEAPESNRLAKEMKVFLDWFNSKKSIDGVIKAAVAHLWFVTVHPFDDGNGRIARAIGDMQLARSEGIPQRFYSLSAQIRQERPAYYEMLEQTQKGTMDVTIWLEWFLGCFDRALSSTEKTLQSVHDKARFWENYKMASFNPRQQAMLGKLFDGFVGKLTSTKWAKMAKCSQDTALRDIQDLLERKVLIKEEGGGRSTSYSLRLT